MLTTYSDTRQKQQPIISRAIREAITAQARSNLIDFAQFIDPTQKRWYRAKHLRMIADVLERVERGELKRVIISVPPRHWKSSLVSEKFPAWYLGRNSSNAIILCSYALSLAEKFSRSIRETIVTNARYAGLFDVKLKRDSNRADDWSLTSGVRSSVRAVGVGGGITGHGAQLILIDDPIADYEAAQSETQRNNLWEWYRQVLRTRLEPGGAIVLIQTRWHEDDLAGRLIRAENEDGGERWHTINLPALSADGAYLWTDRYTPEDYAAIQSAVGEYAWNALYQGNPVQPSGNLIKREWFEYVHGLPVDAKWQVRAWDVAFTEKQTQKHDPDYTATVAACKHKNILYLGMPRLFRKNIEGVATEIVTSKYSEPSIRYGMGQVAIKASVIEAMVNAGLALTDYKENTDKIARASAWTNWASCGRVMLVGDEKEWEAFMAQWVAFPNGAHDDAVDAVSGISQMLNLVINIAPEQNKESVAVLEPRVSMFNK
jgi:predicted phage terminase large subunit-like protein